MRHRSARRFLPQLLDETLALGIERQLRAHLATCGRCQGVLAEFELCNQLVGRLPHGLFPVAGAAAGERRLAGLASWAFPRRVERPWRVAEGIAAAVAAGAVAGVLAFAGAARWLPTPAVGASSLAQVVYVMPAAVEH